MTTSELNERFSRQVILPSVGIEGQKKWESSSVLLSGEGPALESTQTALERVGLSNITLVTSDSPPASSAFTIALVLTENADFRRQLNRHFRRRSQSALFAWPAGTGYALFLGRYPNAQCPCLECFETLNPKAFGRGTSSIQRILGAMAASEALQWILKGGSPLEGKVWMTSIDGGLSFHHQVHSINKCPARLSAEGATVTP